MHDIAPPPSKVNIVEPVPGDHELSDADFADQLEKLAQDIKNLERTAVIKIAARVAKAHELFLDRRDEGGFRGWVQDRLGYSRSHAYRLLAADKWIKRRVPSWDTLGTLPVSAIYLLASSSTPEKVSDQIVERLKAGERISLAMVTEMIASAQAGPIEEPQPAPANPTESTKPQPGDESKNAADDARAGHDPDPEESADVRKALYAEQEATARPATPTATPVTAYLQAPEQLRELLDVVGVQKCLEAASPEFIRDLNARVPSKQPRTREALMTFLEGVSDGELLAAMPPKRRNRLRASLEKTLKTLNLPVHSHGNHSRH